MSDKMREAMIDQDGAVWEKIGGAWSLYRQAARTVPEGFVMVPIEPTPDMVCAAIVAGSIDEDDVLYVWGEMLSAAPEPKK